jgi:hypothetical protein
MSKNIQRLIRIHGRLQRGPVTIDIISKWAKSAGIDVSNRQLYRDLINLQQLKFAEGENVVEYVDEKNRKTWKLEYAESVDAITQYDISSFFLFKNFVPSSIQQHRQDSLEKFEKILYKNFSKSKYQRQVEATELFLRKTNYQDIIYSEIEHKHIEDLIWALQYKRSIMVLNNAVNSSNINFNKYPFPQKLLPVEMLFHDGQAYISGVESSSGKLLIYQINKHLMFELTPEIFNRNKILKKYKEQLVMRFGVAEPTNNKIYNIKIEFTDAYGLAQQKNFLHETATWKKLKNGNYMLGLRCCITRELMGLLGFSLDKVKVHQPKKLSNLLIKKFKDTLALYEGKDVDEEKANRDY